MRGNALTKTLSNFSIPAKGGRTGLAPKRSGLTQVYASTLPERKQPLSRLSMTYVMSSPEHTAVLPGGNPLITLCPPTAAG